LTSRAFLTFVAISRDGQRVQIPGLLVETDEDRQKVVAAEARRVERLAARKELEARCDLLAAASHK